MSQDQEEPRFVVSVRPEGLSFGASVDGLPRYTRKSAIRVAVSYAKNAVYNGHAVQIIDEKTGRIENVTRFPDDHHVILVMADASNPCSPVPF